MNKALLLAMVALAACGGKTAIASGDAGGSPLKDGAATPRDAATSTDARSSRPDSTAPQPDARADDARIPKPDTAAADALPTCDPSSPGAACCVPSGNFWGCPIGGLLASCPPDVAEGGPCDEQPETCFFCGNDGTGNIWACTDRFGNTIWTLEPSTTYSCSP